MQKAFWKFLPFWTFLILFKFGAGLHYTLMAPFGARLLPLWIVGLLIGGAAFVELLLDIPAGYLLDRYGYRRFLKITTCIFLLAAACFVFKLTLLTYLLSLLFSIFGWQFFGPGVNAYILSAAPLADSGKFMSFRDTFSSVGIVLSSATLPFILLFSPQYVGITLVFLLLAALVMIYLSPKDHLTVHQIEKSPVHHYYIRRRFFSTLKVLSKLNPASTMLLLVYLVSGIFYGMIWFAVPLIIAAQAQNEWLGLGLGVFDFAIVVLGYLIGALADRSDKRAIVFVGLIFFSVFGMLLGLNFGILFLLFGFLATAGEEMAELSLWSWLHTLDTEHAQDGTVSGVIALCSDLGWTIGPVMAGIAYGLIGPSWTIVLGAIPVLIVWIIYRYGFHQKMPHDFVAGLIPRKPYRFRHKN